jgi:hypothetical protein
MGHLFISHSHKDSSYVHKLADALQNEGFEVWIDDRIHYGSEWPKVVTANLDASDGVIVVLSSNSYESDMVQNEVTRAREKKKPIFPLLLEGENWLIVQAKQFVDIRDGSLPTEKFYKRLEEITSRGKTGRGANKKTSREEIGNEDLSKRNIKIQLAEYNQPKGGSGQQQASIYVVNNEDEDLTECVGTLVSMTYYWENGSSTDFKDVMVLPRQLAWSSKTRPTESHLITIKPGKNQKAILDVARTNNGEMIFTFATGDAPNHRMIGVFEFTIEIAGKINGHPFQSVESRFRLDFRGGDALVITKVEDGAREEKKVISERLPLNTFESKKSNPISKPIEIAKPEKAKKSKRKLNTSVVVAIIGAMAVIVFLVSMISKFSVLMPRQTSNDIFTPTIIKTHSAITNFEDDFSSDAVGTSPAGWLQRGEKSVNPTVVDFDGIGPSYHAVSFPEVGWEYWNKWLLKSDLVLSGSYIVKVKLNFQNQVADRAGITIAWDDANSDHIDIQPNVYGQDIEFRITYNGSVKSNVQINNLRKIPVVAGNNYWLKIETKDGGSGNGQVNVYWSTDDVNYQLVVVTTGIANLTGLAGIGTAGPHLPNVIFDDFQVTQ